MIKINYEPDHISISHRQQPDKDLILTYYPFQIKQVQRKSRLQHDQQAEGILGIKIFKNYQFLLIVTQSHAKSSIYLDTIYQIRQIKWIPIVPKSKQQQTMEQCEQLFKEINKLFQKGNHYYSHQYKIYQPFLENIEMKNNNQKNNQKNKYYQQFIWNHNIMTANYQYPKLSNWCLSIIQGYTQSFSLQLPNSNNQIVVFTVISRRSNKKAGTRYYARGIDQNGNVANFAQTQQIVMFKGYAMTFLQIRGSVPAFFQQTGVSGLVGQLTITRNQGTTQRSFEQHFGKLKEMYGNIMCVNLLSKKKPDEEKLINFYQSILKKNALPNVDYTYFDFHEECKNNKFQNSSILVDTLKPYIAVYGFSVIKLKQNTILNRQSGILRVNCLDCLDRTNFIQSRVALEILQKQIQNFRGPQQVQGGQKFKIQQNFPDILPIFNEVWADNGDTISCQYTGIGSTHTDITKTGKRTISGTFNHKIRSVRRFFNQFTDSKKHEAITDLLSSQHINNNTKLPQNKHEFLQIIIMSYNVFKQEEQAKSQINLDYTFTEQYVVKTKPSIIAIFGFMDKDPSFFGGIFIKKNTQLKYFIEDKSYHIKTLGYQNFAKVITDNSCLLLFCQKDIQQHLYNIEQETIYRNKDEMLVCRLSAYNSSMVFSGANCSNFQNFKQLVKKTHDQAFQGNKLGKNKSIKISDHHYRTIFGNIGKLRKTSLELQERLQSRKILEEDQLEIQRQDKQYQLSNYMQAPMEFNPKNNRLLFWNQDSLMIKIGQYKEHKSQKCIYGRFSYEVNL